MGPSQIIHYPIESSLVSLEKENKAKNTKIIRAARSQLEKLVRILVHFFAGQSVNLPQLSTRSRLLEEARSELYVACTFTMHICQLTFGISGP